MSPFNSKISLSTTFKKKLSKSRKQKDYAHSISFNFTANSRKQLIKRNFPTQLKQVANANHLLPLDSKSFEFPTRIGLPGTWILITWENGDPYIRPISRSCELSIIPFRFTKRAFPSPPFPWRPAAGGEGFRGEKRRRGGMGFEAWAIRLTGQKVGKIAEVR